MFQRASVLWSKREAARARVRRGPYCVPSVQAAVCEQVAAWESSHPPPKKRRLDPAPLTQPREIPHVGMPAKPLSVDPSVVKVAQALFSITLAHPTHCPQARKFSKTHPSLRSSFKSQCVARLHAFSKGTLCGALRAWRRYIGFLARLPAPTPPPFPADPGNVSVFLQWVSRGENLTKAIDDSSKRVLRGGGGAVQSIRSGLAFLNAHLRLPFPTDDIDVRAAGGDAPVMSKGQASH